MTHDLGGHGPIAAAHVQNLRLGGKKAGEDAPQDPDSSPEDQALMGSSEKVQMRFNPRTPRKKLEKAIWIPRMRAVTEGTTIRSETFDRSDGC